MAGGRSQAAQLLEQESVNHSQGVSVLPGEPSMMFAILRADTAQEWPAKPKVFTSWSFTEKA